ncbi:MAG: molybdopterin molybdotransferase MoeA [Hyphomicrobiales bacterium]|nr:molybdopterin molybdotransferase MoeA [Hyphomicrobiales bacterium]MBV9589647.1 molybdopterin molybdotransferase MoeA [Hyphomicrobiales bacterium]MBV9975247.1 molybdopterin molybdotransferase MoeA [Hyphomicrobiales bacterium]
MAQLTDDCFAFGGALMPVDAALRLIADRIMPVAETQEVRLSHADGRVVAADILSPIALPPFANSAVDGYAVRHVDLDPDAPTQLPLRGRIAAGGSATGLAARQVAVRVFTGAPLPDDADTVFMQEDAKTTPKHVILPPGLRKGANLRRAGEDVARGAVVLPAGRRMRPQDVALAAAVGIASLPVRRQLKVALFSTGDELVESGEVLAEGAIYDSNRLLLAALLQRFGVQVSDLGILRDDRDELAGRLEAAASGHDLILTSGGVSTGEEDHVKAAVESIGKLVFWRLAIKPGRPVALGIIDGIPFAGLPGNPVAVFVTFCHVVRPLLARLSGMQLSPLAPLEVRAAFSYKKKPGRREYVRVSLRISPDGKAEAVKHAQEGAGILTSLTETHGLAELAEDVSTIAPGDAVGFLPYAMMW